MGLIIKIKTCSGKEIGWLQVFASSSLPPSQIPGLFPPLQNTCRTSSSSLVDPIDLPLLTFPQPQQALPGNPQGTSIREAGRLTANLHLSVCSFKSNLPVSSPAAVEHLLLAPLPLPPSPADPHTSSTTSLPLSRHCFVLNPNSGRHSLGTHGSLLPGEPTKRIFTSLSSPPGSVPNPFPASASEHQPHFSGSHRSFPLKNPTPNSHPTHSLVYLIRQLREAFSGNTQVNPAMEAGRLNTDLHLSLCPSKANPQATYRGL